MVFDRLVDQETSAALAQLLVLLLQMGQVFQQSSGVEGHAVLGFTPGDKTAGKDRLGGFAHGLLQFLFQAGLPLFLLGNFLPDLFQLFIRLTQFGVVRKVHHLIIVTRKQTAQGQFRRGRAVSRWSGISFNVVPEFIFQLDKLGNHGFVPFDTEYLQ